MIKRETDVQTNRHKEGETDSQKERQIDRQRERKRTERETERQKERQRDRQTYRRWDRQPERETDRQTEGEGRYIERDSETDRHTKVRQTARKRERQTDRDGERREAARQRGRKCTERRASKRDLDPVYSEKRARPWPGLLGPAILCVYSARPGRGLNCNLSIFCQSGALHVNKQLFGGTRRGSQCRSSRARFAVNLFPNFLNTANFHFRGNSWAAAWPCVRLRSRDYIQNRAKCWPFAPLQC